MSRYKIEPDYGLLVAAERLCSGANVHDLNGAMSDYKGWCEIGNEDEVLIREARLRALVYKLSTEPSQ